MELKEKCPFCDEKENIRRHGHFTVKAEDEDGEITEKTVDRFFCKSCKRLFSSHTQVSQAWADGISVRAKYLTKKYKRKDWQSPIRLPSKYRKEKRELIFKKIDERLKKHGMEKVSEFCRKVGVSHSTYYKYMQELSDRFKPEIKTIRSNGQYKNLLLSEWKIKVPYNYEHPHEIIRFLLLIDIDTGLILDFFFLQKKVTKISYHGRATTLYGHRFSIADLVKYMDELIGKYPKTKIQIQCSEYIFNKLASSNAEAFIPSVRKTTQALKTKMKKYHFEKSPKYVWAIHGPQSKLDSRQKYLSKYHLKSTLEILIMIYNSSVLQKLNK